MKLKEIDRTGNVAWSPATHHPIVLAVGTAAQQLDATFSTNALLELYTLSLNESSQEMEVAGSLTTDSRFYKLVWGSAGQLIGGAEQGQIFIWDPEKICRNEGALVHSLKKHTGPVAALDMNPFQTNLLASGAGDSEIYVWDLSNPDKPMAPGAKAQPVHDVSCVAWNRQVQHILGSSHGGSCVVWDLRKNEPIIKIRDSMSRIKCNTMCWHPDIATQLCISSEDDHTPVIQLWDLRSASSPLKVLEPRTWYPVHGMVSQ
jgi:protein transport protein SEC31